MKNLKLFWPSEAYGFGFIFRKIASFPQFLPLMIYTDHSGPQLYPRIFEHELNNTANIYLCFSLRRKLFLEKYLKKKIHVIEHPYIFFNQNLFVKKHQKKTFITYFPTHTLPRINELGNDFENQIRILKNINQSAENFRVSLTFREIENKIDTIYRNNNLEIVTAGYNTEDNFVQKLYEIITSSSLIIVDDVTTILFFAIEKNIPVALNSNLLRESLKDNVHNILEDESTIYKKIKPLIPVFEIGKSNYNIDPELKEIVNLELGKVTESLSVEELKKIIWKEFFKSVISLKLFILIVEKLYKYFKIKFNNYYGT